LEQRPWKVRVLDLPLLLLEGCIASVPLIVVGAALLPSSSPLLAGSPEVSSTLLEALVLASAAALSEELIFRMGGMSLMHWLIVDVLKLHASTGTTIAVVVTSLTFMLYHDPWSMSPQAATFILVSGLYLGTLFAQRGFATAVLAHAAYNVIALA
jgi:membrane protease YdiL (CAAX protease family)